MDEIQGHLQDKEDIYVFGYMFAVSEIVYNLFGYMFAFQ